MTEVINIALDYYFSYRDVINTSQVVQSFKDLMLSEESEPESKHIPSQSNEDKSSTVQKKSSTPNAADATVR